MNTKRVLASLIVGLLALFAVPGQSYATGHTATETSNSSLIKEGCSPGIPPEDCQATIDVYNFALSHNWAAPPNIAGNKPYLNTTGLLPADGDYLEYDLYVAGPGGRLSQRLVIDKKNPAGNSWYTHDHYENFQQFYVVA